MGGHQALWQPLAKVATHTKAWGFRDPEEGAPCQLQAHSQPQPYPSQRLARKPPSPYPYKGPASCPYHRGKAVTKSKKEGPWTLRQGKGHERLEARHSPYMAQLPETSTSWFKGCHEGRKLLKEGSRPDRPSEYLGPQYPEGQCSGALPARNDLLEFGHPHVKATLVRPSLLEQSLLELASLLALAVRKSAEGGARTHFPFPPRT